MIFGVTTNQKTVPNHIAIVMDGNGRWAERRGYPRHFGHIRGVSCIRPVVETASNLGVKALTLYAFSTENWSRSEAEKNVLWKLLVKFLKKEEKALEANNIQLRVFGQIEKLPSFVRSELIPTMSRLSKNTGLSLNFAVSYGARNELLMAMSKMASEILDGRLNISQMDEELVSSYLYTSCLNPYDQVDLVIRTSGEQRISNFLLWQAAYAEYVFLDACWPDFRPEHFKFALEEYQKRERRFGGVPAQKGKK